LGETVPKQGSNPYAETGTLIHALATEFAFKEWTNEEAISRYQALAKESKVECLPIREDDFDSLRVYTDFLKERRTMGGTLQIEKQLYLNEHLFGTSDLIHIVDDRLTVADYKHGVGVGVSPEHNTQLMLYAFMALQNTVDIANIELYIIQPRFWGTDPIKVWSVSPEYLNRWFNSCVKPIIEGRQAKRYSPGEWCKYCPLLSTCPKQKEVLTQVAKVDFEEVLDEIPLPTNPADLSKALEWAPVIQAWIAALHNSAYEQLNAGQKIPGFKLVRKGTRRKWRTDMSQEDILETLCKEGLQEESLVETKLRSFTAIEKISKEARELVAGLVEKPEGALTVVSNADTREEVRPLLNDFTNVE